jgi:hypothetical protein
MAAIGEMILDELERRDKRAAGRAKTPTPLEKSGEGEGSTLSGNLHGKKQKHSNDLR